MKSSSMIYNSSEEINQVYSMIQQLQPFIDSIPLYSSMEVADVLDLIEFNKGSPDKEQLCEFARNIQQAVDLRTFIKDYSKDLSLWLDLSEQMILPDELQHTFVGSFDEENNLSVEKFPIIKDYRNNISSLRARIIQTLQNLLQSNEMKDKIADNVYIEIDGRFCLMLRNTYKKGYGIVHGSSNTGRTIYVEPSEIIEASNEMRSIQAQLKQEENKIYFEMCRIISKYLQEIKNTVEAISVLDVIRAKAVVGNRIQGVIPEVGNEGHIECYHAKHPVLMLRKSIQETSRPKKPDDMIEMAKSIRFRSAADSKNKVLDKASSSDSVMDVVGNNILLNNETTALVISGPNAGGKTIVLKTCGLFALMVRHAIPVPAKTGARVDLFHVMADIGDMQTVSGDLSTFSGHLTIFREMLKQIHEPEHILLDEIGTGTDPAQGAALAQAILEELVNKTGCRVMVTTHYQRIKELAAHDARFQIAAMEFVNNKPAYRLRTGFVGESYALEAAKRMDIPERVLQRADALLDDESKRLVALQKRLEEETELARIQQQVYETKIQNLQDEENGLIEAQRQLNIQIQKLRDNQTEEFLMDLKKKEMELEEMIERVQEISFQFIKNYKKLEENYRLSQEGYRKGTVVEEGEDGWEGMDLNDIGALKDDQLKELENMKNLVKDVRISTEKEVVDQIAENIAIPLVTGEAVEEGSTLIILEKGNLFGTKGIVTQRNKGRGRVLIRVAGVEIKMERHLLGRPLLSSIGLNMRNNFMSNHGDISNQNGEGRELSSKEKKLLKILDEELVDPSKLSGKGMKKGGVNSMNRNKVSGLKTVSNTFDIRNVSGGVTEAMEVTIKHLQSYINKLDDQSQDVVYMWHGNNIMDTASKFKYRSLLGKNSIVRKCYPALLADGGDAYTVVELSTTDQF